MEIRRGLFLLAVTMNAKEMLPDGHSLPDLAPVPTVASIANGLWSDPGTWTDGKIPWEGDVVAIETNVRYDVTSDAAIAALAIHAGGTLEFSPHVPTRLRVGTLQVHEGGTLRIGTRAEPVTAKAELVFLDQPPDRGLDPEQYGTGLIALGDVSIEGTAKEPWARLAEEVRAGDATLTLARSPAGWGAGDRIFVPDSRQLPIDSSAPYQGEFRTLTRVGEKVTVEEPFALAHPGARDAEGELRFLPAVANLSRTVIVRSENPEGTRGHGFFSGNGLVSIRHAAFVDLGRTTSAPLDNTAIDAAGKVTRIGTNQIGRYPLHLHHHRGPRSTPADGHSFVLEGNAVHATVGTNRWGITVHRSHHGLIKGNVIVGVAGSGIVTEDGNETGNVFEGNFVSQISGRGRADQRSGEIGIEGSAYWFRGGNNIVRGNLASAATYGYTYYARSAREDLARPAAPGAEPTEPISPTATPILAFENNEAGGTIKNGFTNWWIGTHAERPIPGMAPSVIRDFIAWHCCTGVSGYESASFHYDGITVLGDKRQAGQFNSGMGFSDYIQKGLVIRRADIQNMRVGIQTPAIADVRGASGTNPGLVIIRDSLLRNASNLLVQMPWHNATARDLPPVLVHLDNIRFVPLPGAESPTDIRVGVTSGEFTHHTQWVGVFARAFNGNPADNFEVFSPRQAPDFLVPVSARDGRIVGAPEPGLSAGQAWKRFGIANLGGVAPTTATRPGIDGFIAPIDPDLPLLCPLADRELNEGEPFHLRISAYNPPRRGHDAAPSLRFALDEAPANMTIDPTSGRIDWSAEKGRHRVTVRVTDETEARRQATSSFELAVGPGGRRDR